MVRWVSAALGTNWKVGAATVELTLTYTANAGLVSVVNVCPVWDI